MRNIVLSNKEIYHVVNRSIGGQPVFADKRALERARLTLSYYRFSKLPLRLSHLLQVPISRQEQIVHDVNTQYEKRVEVLAYCFMPNHFHFLLRQRLTHGITRFVADVCNSYTRYYNTRQKGRKGPIFQGIFRAVRIENEEQLLHVSRYIHINPVVSYLIEESKLEQYRWSSLSEYLRPEKEGFCNSSVVLGHFPSPSAYIQFLQDQVDYGKKLEEMKHLYLEG